jgi:imidazolonepropionase-like amidohydrolase
MRSPSRKVPSRCAMENGILLCLLTTVTLVLIGTYILHAQPRTHEVVAALAITHVTVIDATGSPAQPDMTVVIEGDRIAVVGKSAEVSLPNGAQVVDATGKFLIPGLVDMHVHTSWDEHFVRPLMLANGVTGVREMYAYDFPAIQRRRSDVLEGKLVGPRILAAGPIVDGPDGPWPGAITVHNAAEARAAVDWIKSQGYDFVKVYSSLDREAYFAIADEAKKDGIPFAGHIPGDVHDSEASNAGQKSIEHLLGISLACSAREDELQSSPEGPKNTPAGYFGEQQAELDSFSEVKADALFAQFRKNGTWQVPTLVVMRNAALYGDPEYVRHLSESPRLRYVPYALKMMWNLGMRFPPKMTPEQLATSRKYFQWQLRVVGEMQKAGVGILAGTDTPNPYVYPGYGLQDELGLLGQAGLTPMQALQAATRNPAQFLGKLDSMGTIENGKVADLDLLDANPLDDIHNTQALSAVVLGGRLITKSGLVALLAKAETNRWRANPAAITLIRLVLHLMRRVVYIALTLLLALVIAVGFLVQRLHAAKAAKTTNFGATPFVERTR